MPMVCLGFVMSRACLSRVSYGTDLFIDFESIISFTTHLLLVKHRDESLFTKFTLVNPSEKSILYQLIIWSYLLVREA